MKKLAALLLVSTLPVASAQRPNVPVKMSWSWMEDSAGKSVMHDGSLVVSFGCGPVEAGHDSFPEGDPSNKDTKWSRVEFQTCGDSETLKESVHIVNYVKEIDVNYETTDKFCKEDTCLLLGKGAAITHRDWNGHPTSYAIVQSKDSTEIGWFIVLDKHVEVSLVFDAPTSKYSPDDWKAFSNSLMVKLYTPH